MTIGTINATEMNIPCDLTEGTFADAVGLLKCLPDQVTVYCAHAYACEAYKIQKQYGCAVILLPQEILKDQDHWAVQHASEIVWSEGS